MKSRGEGCVVLDSWYRMKKDSVTSQGGSLGSLGLASTPWSHIASSAARGVPTAATIFGITTSTFITSTTTPHATSLSVVASISICSGSAFFHVNLFSSYGMRICGSGGMICSCVCELYKGTVLSLILEAYPKEGTFRLPRHTFGRLTSKYRSFPY